MTLICACILIVYYFWINETMIPQLGHLLVQKKKNNIIDGCFSKLIYSTDCFIMNGIFLVIPFICKSCSLVQPNIHEKTLGRDLVSNREHIERKYNVFFYTYDIKNLQYITLLSEIENMIINTYKEINGLTKCNSLVLTNQLYKGFFKIYKDKQYCKCSAERKYMLKISGIWENATEVGITYKFTELCEQ